MADLLGLISRAAEVIQRERDVLVDCHTFPFGDLATLSEDVREDVERYDSWLADARDALAVQP